MEKTILRQIKNLKRIRPNTSWLESQRSFLLSEISREENMKKEPSLILPLFNFNILKIFKPAFAFALGIVILISSFATVGVISAAQNSVAGNFLYPLKTAFEKTQFTFTPGEFNKTKLSIKFATQRIDEFNQLMGESSTKQDIEKTVKSFTSEMVILQTSMDSLKGKNVDKAAEIAKLIQAQTPLYEETLIRSNEKLGYMLPGEKEELKKETDNALAEITKTNEQTKQIISESSKTIEQEEINPEDMIVPQEADSIESKSAEFESIQPKVEPDVQP
jgi:hypothetical protein